MKRKVILFLVVNSMFSVFFISIAEVRAEIETNVTRNVGITFEEKNVEPSKPDQPTTPEDESDKGVFPQTNEKYSRHLGLMGVILILWSMLIYKKREDALN